MSKVRSVAITIRPSDGVTDTHISKFSTYVKRKCEYYYIITEKEDDERHIHAGLIYKNPVTVSNVCTELLRVYKDLNTDEKLVLRRGIKVMYNNDFISKYMAKGDSTVVVERNLPEDGCLESYFPPPLPSRSEKASLNHHSTMKRYESLWQEHIQPHVEVRTDNVRDFLFQMQYCERRIGLLTDSVLWQHARWFTRWMNRADVCRLELPPFEKEEGPGLH